MPRNSIIYLVIVGLLGLCLWLLLQHGQYLEVENYTPLPNAIAKNVTIWSEIAENLHHPLAILLLQIIVIIFVARMLGWLMAYIGQPTVIGEIAAGILLGPSLLGWLAPEFSAFVFPTKSLVNLQFLSHIGLILFMFIIGMELDLRTVRRSAKDAILISHIGIIFPYFLGVSLAYYLYGDFAPEHVPFLHFSLFMGISMSITAFPVLARIVQERGLTRTPLGNLIIACAAIDDVTAWCILAAVIALVKAGSPSGALLTIGLSVVYVVAMLWGLRPFLERVANRYFSLETLSKPIIAMIFLMLILSSFITEVIGIHALIGAFLAGVIMPSQVQFRHIISNKIEDVALVLLLPLFFVVTGLRTEIGLLNSPRLWLICGFIILTAVTGKFGAASLMARITGKNWLDSFAIGALMNTRGLMELVVLNIGYDLGVLSPTIFAMMVIMALVTTCMTGPALDIIAYFRKKIRLREQAEMDKKSYKVLISFGLPKAGARILQLIHELRLTDGEQTQFHALHLTPSADISMKDAELFEKKGFAPILAAAKNNRIALQTYYRPTNNLNSEIIKFANANAYDLMFVGSSRPLFSNSETGGAVQEFIEAVRCPVGILIDKNFDAIQRILLIINVKEDILLLEYLNNFIKKEGANLIIFDPNNWLNTDENPRISRLELPDDSLSNLQIADYDLLLTSRGGWEGIKAKHQTRVASSSTSILIIRK